MKKFFAQRVEHRTWIAGWIENGQWQYVRAKLAPERCAYFLSKKEALEAARTRSKNLSANKSNSPIEITAK